VKIKDIIEKIEHLKSSNQLLGKSRNQTCSGSKKSKKTTCTGNATPTRVLISSIILGLPSHCISNSIVTPSPPSSIIVTPKEEHQQIRNSKKCIMPLTQ
jgi:hypothetical protein